MSSDLARLVRKADAAATLGDARRYAVYQAIVGGDPEFAQLIQRMGRHEQCEDWLFHAALRFGGKRPIDVYQDDRAVLLEFLRRMLPDRAL